MYRIFIYEDNDKNLLFPAAELDLYYMTLGDLVRTNRQKGWEELNPGKKSYKKDFDAHVFGARGEVSGCLIKGVPYNPTVNTFTTMADAGSIEFRTDGGLDWGLSVKVKSTDKDSTILVSMGGKDNIFVAYGYHKVSLLRDMKKKEEFQKDNKNFDPYKEDFRISRTRLLPYGTLSRDLFFFKDPMVEYLEKRNEELSNLENTFRSSPIFSKMMKTG